MYNSAIHLNYVNYVMTYINSPNIMLKFVNVFLNINYKDIYN